MGIAHNVTTPVHPCSNGKIDRFNRVLKEMAQRLCNNAPATWEDQLADALYAHRNVISNTTGHTPFHVLYGRHGRLPLTRILRTTHATTFGNRLDNLAATLKKQFVYSLKIVDITTVSVLKRKRIQRIYR